MKRILSYITISALAAVVLAGCSKDAKVNDGGRDGMEGMGCLVFNVTFDKPAATRAGEPAIPTDYSVKIANSEGYLYIYENVAQIPDKLWLLSGNDYSITVEGGTNTDCGWDTPYYKGTEPFTITAGQNTAVTVQAAIQNTLFSVAFDDTITTGLEDYSVTLFPVPDDSSKTLVFDKNNPEAVGYVMLADGQTTVDWAFNGNNGEITKSGTLEGLLGGKKYALTFTYTKSTGGFDLSFTVVETTVDLGHTIIISQRPRITADGFNFDETQRVGADYGFIATASSAIASITLSGSVFAGGYDLLDAGNDPVADYGVTVNRREDNNVAVSLTADLFEKMETGRNDVVITVTDSKGFQKALTFKVWVPGPSSLSAIARKDVWATHVHVRGIVGDITDDVRFGYRAGTVAWTYVDGDKLGDGEYYAKIGGLTPATAYEASLWVDGEMIGEPEGFTTETATPLPNGGFEEWHQNDKKVWYANAASADKFWDSGNEGTVTAPLIGKEANNITTGESGGRPGSTGSKYANLKSAYFGAFGIGAFAAGNIYSGDFIEARVSTNPSGRVKFGRPWPDGARPSALKVWYKATLGNVNYAKDGAPISKGDKDKFQILIALADSGLPYTIDTAKWETFINYESDTNVNPETGVTVGIVAHGDLVGTSDVGEWTSSIIPLKYHSLDRIPTHIIVTASASMYGDYFAGSTSSVLCIDDFELIYDDNITLKE